MRHLIRTAVGLVAGFVLLSGCSALGGIIPGAGPATTATTASTDTSSAPATKDTSGQSTKDACAALGTAMSEASSTFETAVQDAGSDPAKAVKALETFKDSLTKASAKVDNAQVKAQVQKLVDALTKLIPLLEDGVKDPTKMADAMAAMTGFQSELSAFATLCTG